MGETRPPMRPYPAQTCMTCGDHEECRAIGRGFPPETAERRLRKRCKSNGCACDPKYMAGIDPALFTPRATPN